MNFLLEHVLVRIKMINSGDLGLNMSFKTKWISCIIEIGDLIFFLQGVLTKQIDI